MLPISVFLADFIDLDLMAPRRGRIFKNRRPPWKVILLRFTSTKNLPCGSSTETRDYSQRLRKSRRMITKTFNPLNVSPGSSVDGNSLKTLGPVQVQGRSADRGDTSRDEKSAR